jgi:hypothetical protein
MQTLGLSDSTPKSEGRLRALLWPSIGSDVAASTVAQNAMYAGVGVGAVTTIFVLLRITPVSALLDAFLFVILGFGARQFSITASILALLLYVTNVVTSILHGVIGAGGVIAVIITSLFISSIRAAMFMRRHPDALQVTGWTRIWRWTRPVVFTACGVLFALLILAFFIPADNTASRP